MSGLLGLQQGFLEMQEDLSREKRLWEEKKQGYLEEGDMLRAEAEKLHAAVLEQQSQREEMERLENEIALRQAQNVALGQALTKARLKWKDQEWAAYNEVVDKTAKAQQVRNGLQMSLVTNHWLPNSTKITDTKLWEQIVLLTAQVDRVEGNLTALRTAASKEHNGLLDEIKILQKGLHAGEDQLEQQDQLHTEEKRLAEQSQKIVKERDEIKATKADCTHDLERLDADIAAANKAFAGASASARACQNIEGENQKLQDALNQCKAQRGAGS
jgi:hypothetical protein